MKTYFTPHSKLKKATCEWDFLRESINCEVLLYSLQYHSNNLTPDISLAPVSFHSIITDPGSAFVLSAQKIRDFFDSAWFMTQTGYTDFQAAGEINFVFCWIHRRRKNDVYTDKSINLTLSEMAPRTEASLGMFIKAKKLRLACWVHKEGCTGQAISEQRVPPTSERPVMRLLDSSVNVRKSSFSALLQQRLRIPGLGMMGSWGGVQSHTPARWFVIIEGSAISCHPLITRPTP